jgi:hypothetical protein
MGFARPCGHDPRDDNAGQLLRQSGHNALVAPAFSASLSCRDLVDLLVGDVDLSDEDRQGQPPHQRQRPGRRQEALVGTIHAALQVVAQGEARVLRLRVPHVGVLHLQPAGDDTLDEQPLQRRRRRAQQLGPQQLHLAGQRLLEDQVLLPGGRDQRRLGQPGEVAAQRLDGLGTKQQVAQGREGRSVAGAGALDERRQFLPVAGGAVRCGRLVGHASSSIRLEQDGDQGLRR